MSDIAMLTDLFGFDTAEGKYFIFFGVKITFYALCLLSGGIAALFLANYRAHKHGLPWDTYDTVFVFAFPAGVIGGRIWYVIATGMTGLNVFKVWEGGLAIQGGAIGGALIGILVVLLRRKGWDIFDAMDCAGPTILIGQVIGRWGNFVNMEVYGQIVSSSAWDFLFPGIISRMTIGGYFRVPLFFLEAVINLGGYFLITRIIPMCFSKFYKPGDQLFAYFSWYGFVRILLEPLRDKQFNMGAESTGAVSDMQAVVMGIIFVCLGVLAILINHLTRYYLAKKKEKSVKAE